MPIPSNRAELLDQLTKAYSKLDQELEGAGPEIADLVCVDDWTVKDVLAVRAWWTHSVVDWIERGGRGETLDLPAPGFAWRETPALNASIVAEAASQSYESVRRRLAEGYERGLVCIDSLDDHQLCDPHAFGWAGKYPVSRWISINTTRQYVTARKYVRRVLSARDG